MNLLRWLLRLFGGGQEPEPPPGPPEPPLPWRQEMLSLVNLERSGRGPLALSADLNRASQSHSETMASQRRLHHAPNVVEVIGAGQRSTSEIVDSWMASPGHRAILIGPWTVCGFGRSVGADGLIYWTGRFR